MKVMIATPAHDWRVDVRYTDSLVRTIALCSTQSKIAVHPVFLPGEAMIQHARNTLVKLALESDVTDVFFIDSDQFWQPKDFVRLLEHKVDVVGAPIRKKSDKEEYNVRSQVVPIPVCSKTDLWKVDAVGTGFLRVTRKALQAVWNCSQEYEHYGQKYRMVFDVRIVEGRMWGEDTIFCEKLNECDFTVHIDPSCVVPHIGQKVYEGSFLKWYHGLSRQPSVSGTLVNMPQQVANDPYSFTVEDVWGGA